MMFYTIMGFAALALAAITVSTGGDPSTALILSAIWIGVGEVTRVVRGDK